jgi:hypothetical protein
LWIVAITLILIGALGIVFFNRPSPFQIVKYDDDIVIDYVKYFPILTCDPSSKYIADQCSEWIDIKLEQHSDHTVDHIERRIRSYAKEYGLRVVDSNQTSASLYYSDGGPKAIEISFDAEGTTVVASERILFSESTVIPGLR